MENTFGNSYAMLILHFLRYTELAPITAFHFSRYFLTSLSQNVEKGVRRGFVSA